MGRHQSHHSTKIVPPPSPSRQPAQTHPLTPRNKLCCVDEYDLVYRVSNMRLEHPFIKYVIMLNQEPGNTLLALLYVHMRSHDHSPTTAETLKSSLPSHWRRLRVAAESSPPADRFVFTHAVRMVLEKTNYLIRIKKNPSKLFRKRWALPWVQAAVVNSEGVINHQIFNPFNQCQHYPTLIPSCFSPKKTLFTVRVSSIRIAPSPSLPHSLPGY